MEASSPVILVPGFMGWRDLDILGSYFIGLEAALEAAGADVYRLSPPPVADSEVRAAYLAKAIDAVLVRAKPKSGKVAVLAHSQGGVDIRVAMADPDVAAKIAVVVTLSSPHEGTELADAALKLPPPLVKLALDYVSVAWQANQHLPIAEPDAHAVLVNLSRAGMKALNARLPKTSPVPFFSVAALSDADLDGSCAGGKWGAPTKLDALHPLFVPGRIMLRSVAGDVSDDGVVPTARMRFGTFLGCVPGDHVDWMGWRIADRDDEGWTALNERAFIIELWRGMRSVELSGDERTMDRHIRRLAQLASAVDEQSSLVAHVEPR